MDKLELYVYGEKGGYHTLISVHGVSRTQVGTGQDADALMRHAETLLSAEGSPYSPELRVIDPKGIKCRNGDMTIRLTQLRLWNSPSYKGEPVAGHREHDLSEARRALGVAA